MPLHDLVQKDTQKIIQEMKPVRVSTIEEIKDRLMDPDAVVEKAIEESSGYKWAPDISIHYFSQYRKRTSKEFRK